MLLCKGGCGSLLVVRHPQTTCRLVSLCEAILCTQYITGTPLRLGQLVKGFRPVPMFFAGLFNRLASYAYRIVQPLKVAVGDTEADSHEDLAVSAAGIADAIGETLFEQALRPRPPCHCAQAHYRAFPSNQVAS